MAGFIDEIERARASDIDGYLPEAGHRNVNALSVFQWRVGVDEPAMFGRIALNESQAEDWDIRLVLPRPRRIQIRIQQEPAVDITAPVQITFGLLDLMPAQLEIRAHACKLKRGPVQLLSIWLNAARGRY